MFIKFGDKTKPIEVKKTGSASDGNKECVYLDEDESGDRRVNIIKKHLILDEDESPQEE